MSQDVNYATKLAHACAPYTLKWIEECLPPQQYEGYRELKRQALAAALPQELPPVLAEPHAAWVDARAQEWLRRYGTH